jgi:hypothetical protein
MKILFSLALFLLSSLCFAQQQSAVNGNWIKSSIDAFDRVNVTRNGTSDDALQSLNLIHFVSGMLAVHRQNNLTASTFAAVLGEKKTQSTASAADQIDQQLRIAFAFTPLLTTPDTLSPQQIVAILRKYLDANPEKWGTDALQQAFAKK